MIRTEVIGRFLLRGAWVLSWPVRTYWVRSERKLGKRLLLDRLVKPLLPRPPRGFTTTTPGGGVVRLHYREEIGLSTLLGGGFERVELEHAYHLVRPGTHAVDVGANIGLHTVVLASAVGPHGTVLAVEPEPENLRRLHENLALNGFANVDVHPVALAERAGEIVLHLASDGLYHSTGAPYEGGVDRTIRVAAATLDSIWEAAGNPPVSFVKIDTEGAELSVLRGAERLLAVQSPAILIENRDPGIRPWLSDRGYVGSRPRGFAEGNMLFRRESPEGGRAY